MVVAVMAKVVEVAEVLVVVVEGVVVHCGLIGRPVCFKHSETKMYSALSTLAGDYSGFVNTTFTSARDT